MTHKLRVKNESSPERCEICHKGDYLEPGSNVCLRCQDIDLPLTLAKFGHYKEDDAPSFFFSFGSTNLTRVIAGALALLFSIDIIGLSGASFLFGVICLVLGFSRMQTLFSEIKLTSKFFVGFILNLILIGTGLSCGYFSSLYLLKWIN
jgi:general stress protein CsbA